MDDVLVIRNGIVVPMEPDLPFLPSGTVVIRGNRLVEVTADPGTAERYPGAEVLDASGCAVLPGLINCHAHLRPMRALGEGMDVMVWHNQYVDGVSLRMSPEDAYNGAANAFLEMLKNGITTVLGMSILDQGELRAAVDSGIRARIARHSERRSDFEQTIALAEAQRGSEDDRVRLWLGMENHSMFDQAELKLLGEAMERLGLPVHTHISEFRVDPLDPLERAGLLRRGLIAAHCVHLDEHDSARLAAADVAVAHNPKSNMKFGNGYAPIPRYLSLGIRVGMGTDGPLSTFSVDIFEEVRAALLMHRLLARSAAVLSAEQALGLATRGSAAALGLDDQIGTLTPGKKADVIVVDLDQPRFRPLFTSGPLPNLIGLLAFTASGRDVRDVIVDGRVVVRKGRVQTMDEERVKADCQRSAERILGEITAG